MKLTRREAIAAGAIGIIAGSSVIPAEAATQSYGIIYAAGSKMVRRIISGTNNFAGHVGLGEALLVIQQQFTPTVFQAEAAVKAATGVTPASIQTAVVDGSGVIKGVIKADPAIDSIAGLNLIPTYAGVSKDATYNASTGLFAEPIVVIKAGTVLRDGTVTKVDTQTGGVVAKPSLDAIATGTVSP